MKPFYEKNGLRIYHGDCREILPQLGETFESCITDPPYEISFMGKTWDQRGISFDAKTWMAFLSAVKPGGTLLSFGGTRTWHRIACAIEDAGFELRDTIMWLYAEGFPKALDISKAMGKSAGTDPKATTSDSAKIWKGWYTALKPAWEPILVGMKPTEGTFVENAENHGVAGLNIDGSRLGPRDRKDYGLSKSVRTRRSVYGKFSETADFDATKGRWPANVILDEAAGAMLDAQSGEGGASRFFYCSKAAGKERGNVKYAALPLFGMGESEDRNDHPTVKPLDLMRYLCVLTQTPSGGAVLDPFLGSGTTLLGARLAGRPGVGVELEEQNCEIAAKRLEQPI